MIKDVDLDRVFRTNIFLSKHVVSRMEPNVCNSASSTLPPSTHTRATSRCWTTRPPRAPSSHSCSRCSKVLSLWHDYTTTELFLLFNCRTTSS
jgi:hypothetical protein